MSLSQDTTVVWELFLTACQINELNKVQSLLTVGADVNWREDGWSGLHYAALYNYGELLQ